MKTKAFVLGALCALAVALALPAGGVAATPPQVFVIHVTASFTDDFNGCGIVGTDVVTFTGILKLDASGATMDHTIVRGTFTSLASGKSIVYQNSELEKTTAVIDNADGTLSFVLHGAGLINKVSVLNGPPLGKFAGERDILFTFDPATDDVTLQWLHTGGSSGIVGCDVIVPALT
jgi:hypothetical protein